MRTKPARWAWTRAGLPSRWQSISNGLVLLMPMWGELNPTNLVDATTWTNNGLAQPLYPEGPALGPHDNDTEELILAAADVTPGLEFTGSYTMFWYGYHTTGSLFQMFFCRGNASGDDFALYRNKPNDTLILSHNRNTTGVNDFIRSSNDLATTLSLQTVAARYDSPAGLGGLFIDGEECSYATGPALTEDPSLDGGDWRIGRSDEPAYGGEGYFGTGRHLLAAVWNRALSNDEIRILHDDPYGLLRRGRRRTSVGVVTILLQAAPAAESGVTANLETLALLEATPAGQSAVSAAFTIITKLAADIAAVGTVSGTLSTAAENLLAAIAAGSSTVTADLQTLAELQATPAGQAAVSAILALVKELESNPAAVSSIAAALESTVTTSKGFTALSEALATTITISDE